MATTVAQLAVDVSANTKSAEDSLTGISAQSEKTGAAMQKGADEGKAAFSALGSSAEESGAKVRAGAEEGESAIGGIGQKAEESEGGMKGFLGEILGIGGAVAGVQMASQAFDFLKEQLGETVQAGVEANQTEAQTAAVLKSTHDASGMTAEGVAALAEHYMNLTGVSQDTIQATENMLLTFTGISKNAFPQATQTALDMATALKIGPTQAALQLGKALNDPATGLSALRREGVTFSAQQQEQIKTMVKAGNTAGAQALMLKELQKEFGGSAQAAGQADGGLKILQAQMEATREKIGQDLIPVLSNLAKTFAPIVAAAGSLIPAAVDFLKDHADQAKIVIASFGAVLLTVVVPALWALLTPLLAVVGAAILAAAPFVLAGVAIAGIALAIKHAYDTSKPFHEAVQNLITAVGKIAGIIAGDLNAAFQKIMPYLQDAAKWVGGELTTAFNTLLPYITQGITYLTQFTNWLSTNLNPALERLGGFITGTIVPALQSFGEWLGAKIGPIVQQLASWFTGTLLPAIVSLAGWLSNNLPGAFKAVSSAVQVVLGFLSPLWDVLSAQLQPILKTLTTTLQSNVLPAWQSIQGALGNLIPIIQSVATIVGGVLVGAWNFLKPVLIPIGILIGGTLVVAAGLLVGALSGIIAALGQVIQGAIKFAGGLLQAISGGIQVITSIIRGLLAIIVDVFTGNWAKIGSDAATAWNGIKDGVTNIVSGMWTAIQGLFQAAIGGLVHAVLGFVQGILELLSHIPGPIGDMASKALKGIKDMADGTDTETKKASDAATQHAAEMKVGVLKHTAEMHDQAVSVLEKVRAEIVQKMKDTSDPAQQHALEMKLGVVNHMIDMHKAAADEAVKMADEVVQHAQDMKDGSIKAAQDLGSGVYGVLDGMAQQAAQWGTDLANNFANAIAAGDGTAAIAANRIATKVAATLQHSVPKEGPLANDDEWGGHLVENFANGMLGALPKAHNAASSLAGVFTPLSNLGAGNGVSGSSLYGAGGSGVGGGVDASGSAGAGVTQQIILKLDSAVLASTTVKGLPSAIRLATGTHSM